LVLGTNDFQYCHPYNNAWAASQGIAALVTAIRHAPIEPGMLQPKILVVCPPQIEEPRGPIAAKFRGAIEISNGLSRAYEAVSAELDCEYFDAGSVTRSSVVDGVHLDADQHLTLGRALIAVIQKIL
jgi:lysophospholipase L1-like esterase